MNKGILTKKQAIVDMVVNGAEVYRNRAEWCRETVKYRDGDFLDSNDILVDINYSGDDFGGAVPDLPKEYPLEFFCNVNSSGAHSVHRTREGADAQALLQRVACVALNGHAVEGQGLDMELSNEA